MKVHHNHTAKHLTLGIASTLSLATILGVGIYSATNIVNNTNNANALSYSTNEDISFTFKPTLSISLSTGALTIDNLVPGTTSDSNAATVTVASNTPYGYVLSAGVGSTVSTDPYYNTSDLVHDNSTTQVPTTNKFSSISTTASLESLNTDNTWGYSTSTDGGTNWSTYSGLSHTATKPLLDISDPATPSTIDFKIAARSASTQASGTYNNVITFYAVGKPAPLVIDDLVYMQDFKTISEIDKESVLASMAEDAQYTLKDVRDEKAYYVSMLRDGSVWMTQNLDLNIDSTKTYTPADTDITDNWKPARSTMTDTYWDTKIPTYGYVNSQSYDPGDRYWDGEINFSDYGIDTNTTASGDAHYHIGNYYNWIAAAARDSAHTNLYYNAENRSICPAGWRLPSDSGDRSYQNLINVQGLTAGFSGNIHNDPTYFIYGGTWNGGSGSCIGNTGRYWSSEKKYAFMFWFDRNMDPQGSNGRGNDGFSVRCVAR